MKNPFTEYDALFLVMLFGTFTAEGQNTPESKEMIHQFLLRTDYAVDTTRRALPTKARALANKAFEKRYHEGPLRFQQNPPDPVKSGVVDGPCRVIGFYLRRGEEYVVLYHHGGFGAHEHLLYVNRERKVVEFFHYNGITDQWRGVVEKLRKTVLTDQELLTVSGLES
jgi:hypothetical protein